jgi:hypothetical protein
VGVSDSSDPVAADEAIAILSDMSEVLRQADDRERLTSTNCGRRLWIGVPSILGELSSADMWGHMGSFLDNRLSDRTLNCRYLEQQLQLADVLARLGAEASHAEKPHVPFVGETLCRFFDGSSFFGRAS